MMSENIKDVVRYSIAVGIDLDPARLDRTALNRLFGTAYAPEAPLHVCLESRGRLAGARAAG